jgi:hypothetical protein
MPLGTWRGGERSRPSLNGPGASVEVRLIGDPVLWQPVLDQIAAQIASSERFHDVLRQSNPQAAAFFGLPRPFTVLRPDFCESAVRDYVCAYCTIPTWT